MLAFELIKSARALICERLIKSWREIIQMKINCFSACERAIDWLKFPLSPVHLICLIVDWQIDFVFSSYVTLTFLGLWELPTPTELPSYSRSFKQIYDGELCCRSLMKILIISANFDRFKLLSSTFSRIYQMFIWVFFFARSERTKIRVEEKLGENSKNIWNTFNVFSQLKNTWAHSICRKICHNSYQFHLRKNILWRTTWKFLLSDLCYW